MTDDDPFDLARFVDAQAPVFEAALAELRAGRKRSHWMWFVFPQMRGLGLSSMAHHYGISGPAEARAYLAHPLLGPRLVEATQAVLGHPDTTVHAIFGSPDDMKFRSSMTLFAYADAGGGGPYRQALDTFCGGEEDAATLALLGVE
ncbi:MAG: DUF1810 domain-containing protein [Rhodospirillaceae bacterium]|nr:DUF1810 domain-containing protein [Rhodospirillaceae bacterium]